GDRETGRQGDGVFHAEWVVLRIAYCVTSRRRPPPHLIALPLITSSPHHLTPPAVRVRRSRTYWQLATNHWQLFPPLPQSLPPGWPIIVLDPLWCFSARWPIVWIG